MGTYILGDRDFEEIPSLSAKALRINLNKHIYGTFSEIGAGQETVRYFFRAGGASGGDALLYPSGGAEAEHAA